MPVEAGEKTVDQTKTGPNQIGTVQFYDPDAKVTERKDANPSIFNFNLYQQNHRCWNNKKKDPWLDKDRKDDDDDPIM